MTSESDLRHVLKYWPIMVPLVRIHPVEPGFSGANLFRIECQDGTWCLRRWPSGNDALPPDRIRELHRWLAFLHDADIHEVAVPLPAVSGETLIEVRGILWQLEPWMPGTADLRRYPSDDRLKSAATRLARLHLASARYTATRNGLRWFACRMGPSPAVLERLEALRQLDTQELVRHIQAVAVQQSAGWLPGTNETAQELMLSAAKAINRIAQSVSNELAALTGTVCPLHPCLRDLWHDHLLFTGDQLTGIIDASAARTENVASDLSRLLGSLPGVDVDRWRVFLNAYAAIRPLSDHEQRLIPALDRSGVVLSAVHWLKRAVMTPLTARELARLQNVATRLLEIARR